MPKLKTDEELLQRLSEKAPDVPEAQMNFRCARWEGHKDTNSAEDKTGGAWEAAETMGASMIL